MSIAVTASRGTETFSKVFTDWRLAGRTCAKMIDAGWHVWTENVP